MIKSWHLTTSASIIQTLWLKILLFMFMTIYTIFVAEVSQEIFVEGMNVYKPLPVLKNESISGHCIVLRMSESVADM